VSVTSTRTSAPRERAAPAPRGRAEHFAEDVAERLEDVFDIVKLMLNWSVPAGELIVAGRFCCRTESVARLPP